MTPIASLRGIYPNAHSQKIAEHFAAQPEHAEDREALRLAIDALDAFCILCFTNRCGSGFLAQALASDGRLQQARESLNFDTVIQHSEKSGFRSFDAYLAAMIRRHTGPARIYAVKANAGQLTMLHDRGILELAGPKLRFVHVSRRQVIDQAISFYIASRTLRWASAHVGVEAEVDYAPQELIGMACSLTAQNAALEVLFGLFDVQPARVDYEALVADPARVVQSVGRYLGIADLALVPAKVSYEKQADELNARLKARLHADFALPRSPAGEPPAGS